MFICAYVNERLHYTCWWSVSISIFIEGSAQKYNRKMGINNSNQNGQIHFDGYHFGQEWWTMNWRNCNASQTEFNQKTIEQVHNPNEFVVMQRSRSKIHDIWLWILKLVHYNACNGNPTFSTLEILPHNRNHDDDKDGKEGEESVPIHYCIQFLAENYDST